MRKISQTRKTITLSHMRVVVLLIAFLSSTQWALGEEGWGATSGKPTTWEEQPSVSWSSLEDKKEAEAEPPKPLDVLSPDEAAPASQSSVVDVEIPDPLSKEISDSLPELSVTGKETDNTQSRSTPLTENGLFVEKAQLIIDVIEPLGKFAGIMALILGLLSGIAKSDPVPAIIGLSVAGVLAFSPEILRSLVFV